MRVSNIWRMVKTAVKDFLDDDATTFAASLAYYTALSLAPLAVLLLSVTAYLGEDSRQGLVDQVQRTTGPQVGQAIGMVIANASERRVEASIGGGIGLAAVLLAATAVFGQLQKSLNAVWDLRARPGQGIWGFIRKRLSGLLMVGIIGLVLLAAMIGSAVLQALLPGGTFWSVVDIVVSLAVFTAIFAMMFRVLPDAEIAWRDVWVGAAVTGVLTVAGKFAIGLYLGRSGVSSSYGAAGSLAVLLVGMFYGWMVVLMGAELTQAWARACGSGIKPDAHAIVAPASNKKSKQSAGPASDTGQEATGRQAA